MRLLEERVAVITGSTKGNGRAMANLFSEQGANVVVTGRDKNEIQSVTDDLVREYKTNPLGLKVDVASAAEVKDMIDRVHQNYGRIDVLVNNAGYPIKDEMWDASFEKIQDQDLENIIDVDTIGTYRCCRETLPVMVEKRREKYGIRCNAIAPGTIATHRNWDRLTTEQRVNIVSSIPFGRAGKPEEVAGVALILACDYTSFVNGQTIVVDGGETIRQNRYQISFP